MLRYLGLPLLLCSAVVWAADAPKPAPVPKPPPMPTTVDEIPRIKPDITITQKKDRVVEEYRINGQLYKVKITPKHGKPYYLLYPHGPQGEAIRRDLDDFQVPSWVIFSW